MPTCAICGREVVKMPHSWWHRDAAANDEHEAEPKMIPRCGYCGDGPCASTAHTADGSDLERFERYHPNERQIA